MFINYFFWIEKQHTLAKKPQKKKIKFFFLFIYLKLSHFLKNVRNSPDHANSVNALVLCRIVLIQVMTLGTLYMSNLQASPFDNRIR